MAGCRVIFFCLLLLLAEQSVGSSAQDAPGTSVEALAKAAGAIVDDLRSAELVFNARFEKHQQLRAQSSAKAGDDPVPWVWRVNDPPTWSTFRVTLRQSGDDRVMRIVPGTILNEDVHQLQGFATDQTYAFLNGEGIQITHGSGHVGRTLKADTRRDALPIGLAVPFDFLHHLSPSWGDDLLALGTARLAEEYPEALRESSSTVSGEAGRRVREIVDTWFARPGGAGPVPSVTRRVVLAEAAGWRPIHVHISRGGRPRWEYDIRWASIPVSSDQSLSVPEEVAASRFVAPRDENDTPYKEVPDYVVIYSLVRDLSSFGPAVAQRPLAVDIPSEAQVATRTRGERPGGAPAPAAESKRGLMLLVLAVIALVGTAAWVFRRNRVHRADARTG